MKTSALSLLAGAAMFGAASAASAAPMTLSTDQLDQVYAGGTSVSAELVGNAIVNGTFFLYNIPGGFSIANISATITPFGNATVTLKAIVMSTALAVNGPVIPSRRTAIGVRPARA